MIYLAANPDPHGHLHYSNILGTDPYSNAVDSIHPCMMQSPTAMMSYAYKSKAYNPDLPTTREALTSPDAEGWMESTALEAGSVPRMLE